MAGLIRYLLLANLFLLIVALFYHLVLSRETWFKTNRYILILGIVLSLILPLFQLNWFPVGSYSILTIPEIIVSAKAAMAHFNIEEIQIIGTAPIYFPWISLFGWTYMLGALTMASILVWKIKKLQYWTNQYPMKWFSNLYITLMPDNWSPFSFLGVVYFPGSINKNDNKVNLILEHEKVHIRQRHGWDVLFIEAVKVLFFYNPAIYTIKKQIQVNHEYIADSEVAGEEPKLYSQELIRSQFQVPQYQFIQQFNQTSFLKRRILMIMKNKSNSFGLFKYLMLVPMIGGLLWISACTDEAESSNNLSSPENTSVQVTMDKTKSVLDNYAAAIVNTDQSVLSEWELQTNKIAAEMKSVGKDKGYILDFVKGEISSMAAGNIKTIQSSELFKSTGLEIEKLEFDSFHKQVKSSVNIGNAPEGSEAFYKVEEMPEFEGGGLDEFKNWVQKNVQYPDIAKENGIAGTVYVNFWVSKTGELTNINIIRNVDPCLDDEVKRVIQSAPSWTPGKQRGEVVNVIFSLPVKFMLQ